MLENNRLGVNKFPLVVENEAALQRFLQHFTYKGKPEKQIHSVS